MSLRLVHTQGELEALVEPCGRAPRLAVDVESNGLFVFRAGLCAMQIAWEEGGEVHVAVIDTRAVDPKPLSAVLGARGPVKVLHDLTFDARMLAEAGTTLRRVRDTSVSARLLGATHLGLASLLAAELGIVIEKRFQQHDWSRRPLTDEQVAYLADDVKHLLALDDRLGDRVRALDLEPEVEAECAYKLASAEGPPKDARPPYARIKGVAALDPVGRAILRRLCRARERAAEMADVPPFQIVTNEILIQLATARPANRVALHAIRGATSGRAGASSDAFLGAIAKGLADGDVPYDEREMFLPARIDRAVILRRRSFDARVTGWRKAEALRRGICEQAVLPGHCASDLVDALVAHPADDPELYAAITTIPGIGARRLERYLEMFVELARTAASTAPAGDPWS